jgi:glycosyltransferase involved in cell wall biosynthesis
MNDIVGICLFKNEDVYAKRVVSNIVDFCDKIIIVDNNSTDKTLDVVRHHFGGLPKVNIIKCHDHRLTGKLTYEYFKTKNFLFAVDGDEIYDPTGLKKIRKRIKEGFYDKNWKISGSSFHVQEWKDTHLSGFTCPPNKHVVKLYNFNVINDWTQGERLHGAGPSPYPNYIEDKISLKFCNEDGNAENQIVPFGFSNLRCLHMCFMPRSSKDLESREAGSLKYRPAPSGHDLDYKPKKYGTGNTHDIRISSLGNFLT